MLNEEQKYIQKQKRKKILITGILIVIGLFVIVGLVTFILSAIKNHNEDQRRAELEKQQKSYNFVEPDYNLNIYDDKEYMQLDRSVHFNDNGAVTVITDENYADYPAEILFMRDVINYITDGDYISYKSIFTDDYVKNYGDKLHEFTMQQLYGVELEIIDSEQSGDITNSAVKVTYYIRHNNGTFRNDLGEDQALPVVYELISSPDQNTGDNEIKVSKLLTYNQYKSGLY